MGAGYNPHAFHAVAVDLSFSQRKSTNLSVKK